MISSRRLLNAAKRSCKDLRTYIAGDLNLEPHEIESRKALINQASCESFYFFAKEVLGFDLLTKQTHKKWCDKLQADFDKFNNLMRLKPRGTFKTTIYGEAFPLWVWIKYSPEIRIFYTSANDTLIGEVSAHLDHFIGLDTESLYSFVFGIKRDKKARENTRNVFNVVGRDKKAKGSSLMFRTAGGSTNGIHPHIIIVDDPCDRLDRESSAVRKSKEHWYDSLIPLLVPYEKNGLSIKKKMVIATRWHLKDILNYIIDKSEKGGTEGTKYDVEIEGVYNDDGTLRYPELINDEKIKELQSEMSDVFFSCQYLNNPLPEGIRIFVKEKLFFIRPEQYDIREGTNYCFFDPSQGKKLSDFPAPIFVNHYNGRMIIFDAIDEKIPLASLVPLVAAKIVDTLTRSWIFETNGTTLLEETFKKEIERRDYSCYIEGIHETRNKEERIAATQPELYNGSVFFREDHKEAYPELMNQVLFYPAWGHDDFPDVIEKALTWILRNSPGTFSKSSGPGGSHKTFAGSLGQSATW